MHNQTQKRQKIVLAALAASKGANHKPVHVQKMFFLIDRQIPHLTDGPYFEFGPYDYGPFDSAVYDVLERLSDKGYVEILETSGWKRRSYRLTPEGQKKGESALAKLSEAARVHIEKTSAYVRSLSFAELVSAIYQAYPEMRVNSVFQA